MNELKIYSYNYYSKLKGFDNPLLNYLVSDCLPVPPTPTSRAFPRSWRIMRAIRETCSMASRKNTSFISLEEFMLKSSRYCKQQRQRVNGQTDKRNITMVLITSLIPSGFWYIQAIQQLFKANIPFFTYITVSSIKQINCIESKTSPFHTQKDLHPVVHWSVSSCHSAPRRSCPLSPRRAWWSLQRWSDVWWNCPPPHSGYKTAIYIIPWSIKSYFI